MPLSRPDNPPIVNESVATSLSSGFSIDESQTKINQLHGIAANNTKGAGIPKQVSNAQVSIANASTGSTCTASILFKADPTDTSLSGINVWVKGYQGNSNPVLVGSGTSSPTKIVLNNTGEIVTFIIQAFGNGGNAPFSQSPTCSGTLPKSTAGGFGATTVTSSPAVSGSATAGQLAKFATPPTTVTGADLTGDATTAGSVATTVGKIQGVPVTNSTPKDGDVLRYSLTDAKYMRDLFWDFLLYGNGTNTPQPSNILSPILGSGNTQYSGSGSTVAALNGTATELLGTVQTTASTNPASAGIVSTSPPANAWGTIRRIRFRLKLNQTTNTRIWIGLTSLGSASTATFRANNPNTPFIGFRYSTPSGDTKYQCYTATTNVAFTSNAESTTTHVDTNVHVFDITWDGVNVTFYIDDVQVGQQSTNVPATSVVLAPAVVIDNAASANAVAFTWMYMKGSLVLL